MKKIFNLSTPAVCGLLLISAVSLGIACSSCTTLEPTSLSEETLSTKSIVCGHVRYIGIAKDGKADIDVPNPGFEVNIFYGLPDANGDVQYAVKKVTTLQDGYFETTLGCPAGQALKVKTVAEGMGYTYASDTDGKSVETEAYFYGSVEKSVDCRMAAYFALDMKPTALIGEPGLK